MHNGIYKLDMPKKRNYFIAKTELWHKRLGHMNYRDIIALSKNPLIEIIIRDKMEKYHALHVLKVSSIASLFNIDTHGAAVHSLRCLRFRRNVVNQKS